MRKKGFTLVELLVVIAIIALLMGILMPALSRVRMNAYQLICGTNLKGIGNSILMYCNQFDEQYPRAGGPDAEWGARIADWDAPNRNVAFNTNVATITSSLFLLIKYGEVTPKVFMCKADSDVTEFEAPTGRDITTLYDFGGTPTDHVSYSYHHPYSSYRLRPGGESGKAVVADKNPFFEIGDQTPKDFANFNPEGNTEAKKLGNSYSHQDEGQQVLFLDNSVSFNKTSACGIDSDNIYTRWATATSGEQYKSKGVEPFAFDENTRPRHMNDSLLVVDGVGASGSGGGKGRACFPADTPVWVDGKLVPISQVIIGKKVGKIDCATSSAAGSIKGIEEHGQGLNDCYEMEMESGNTIIIVHSHYFLTVSDEWVAIEDLTSGMKLQSLNGPISIKSVIKRKMPFTGQSYNLILNDSEQYYVGEDGVVALDCSKKTWELLKLASLASQ